MHYGQQAFYMIRDVYVTLRSVAKTAEEKADFIALAHVALADLYEHVYKIFTLTEENAITAAHEARMIAYWAAITVGPVFVEQNDVCGKHEFASFAQWVCQASSGAIVIVYDSGKSEKQHSASLDLIRELE